MERFLDPEIVKMVRFLDPEISKMVDRSFMLPWHSGTAGVGRTVQAGTSAPGVRPTAEHSGLADNI